MGIHEAEKTVARGTHDLAAIGLCKLGFLFGIQGLFRLGRDSYSLRIPTCYEYRHGCCYYKVLTSLNYAKSSRKSETIINQFLLAATRKIYNNAIFDNL